MGTSDGRSGTGPSPQASLRLVSGFLTANRAEIVARWRGAVRRTLGEEAAELPDPVPHLLDRIAELDPAEADDPDPISATRILEQGGAAGEDAATAVTQLVLLRDQVLELWEELPREGPAALRALNRAVDGAVMGVVMRASAARQRMGRALDRLADRGRATSEVEAQVENLLRIVLEESVAVDSAVLLVRDGDGLRVCCAVGVATENARGRFVRAGEGFPGVVTATDGPISRRWAGDPLALESGPSSRTLYGATFAPFAASGDGGPAGVAYVASVTAHEFPVEDRRLFRMAVDAAASALDASRVRALTGAGDDSVRARDRALGTFAHDVRSPLGVVLMQANVMLKAVGRGEAPNQVAPRAAALERAALRIEQLLGDYQEFHEARAGRLSLTTTSVQPSELVRGAVAALRPAAEGRRVAIEAELLPGLPLLIGDGQRLQEALEHLLRAALQGVADGGRIALRAEHEDGGIVFTVEDWAAPMAPDLVADVFDRAWRGERPGIGRGGLGLGLAKAIVEAHGGRIWATSAKERRGNTFCCALPVEGVTHPS
jgi:signal transduction histidine kinase